MKKYIEAGLFFLSPFLGIFLLEYMIKADASVVFQWMLSDYKFLLLSYVIVLLIQTLFLSIFNNIYMTMLFLQITLLFIGAVNHYKLKILNEPFSPWDFGFAKQVVDLIPSLSNTVNFKLIIIVALVVIVVIGLLIKFTSFKYLPWKIRIIVFFLTVIPIYMLNNYKENVWQYLFDEIEIMNTPWEQKEGLLHNGFVINFVSKFSELKVEIPEPYSRAAVEKLTSTIEMTEEYTVSDTKPNVVVIMSEAFWEVENMTGQFGEESLYPTVLQHKVGDNVSAQYAGGTSNVEFEAITGFSMNLLPPNSTPYMHFVSGEVPSIARVFKEYGYSTTAIHTYYKYFWRRLTAYPSLGFDKFIGLEDLENPKTQGAFVDDVVINDLIMEQLKESKDPQFIYAVTMQNHSLYDDGRYGDNVMNLTNSYSEHTNEMINTYGTGLAYADQLLNELFVQIEALDEPTLVVFFGDHLPYLGNAYEELGYVGEMWGKTLEEELKMKETPIAVWNNYDKEIEQVGKISTPFLAPNILKWAEVELPNYYRFLDSFSKELPAYTLTVKMTKDGELSVDTPEDLLPLESMYRTFQYDLLIGKKYGIDTLMSTK